jgi:hypothetical protein
VIVVFGLYTEELGTADLGDNQDIMGWSCGAMQLVQYRAPSRPAVDHDV